MKNKIAELIFNNVEGLTLDEVKALMEIPPKPDMGDFAFPCFRLAKTMRKAPQMIAGDIKDAIGEVDFLDEIKVQGASLKFYFNKLLNKPYKYVYKCCYYRCSENTDGSGTGRRNASDRCRQL